MRVWDSIGGESISFDSKDIGADFIGCIVENPVTLASLQNRLNQFSNIDSINSSVISLSSAEETFSRSQANNSISSQWINLNLKSDEIINSRLVVGSDGANSKIRSLAGLESLGWDYEQNGLVATLSVNPFGNTKEEINNSIAWQRYLPTGPVAILPLSETKSSLVWSTSSDVAKNLMGLSNEDFVNALNIALNGTPLELDSFLYDVAPDYKSPWRSSLYDRWVNKRAQDAPKPPTIISVDDKSRATFPLKFRNCPSYIAQRIALIGDAAHSIHPHAGLGLNIGYQDVISLSTRLIEGVKTGQDIGNDLLLQEYSRERITENLPMMSLIDGLKRILESQTELLVLGRSLGLKTFNSIHPIKQTIMKYAMGGGLFS